MNKILLLALVCTPFYVQAVDEYLKPTKTVIPSAAVALAEARAITKIKIANEVPLLTQLVVGEIKSTADEGYTMCNPDVSKYHTEAIHLVAVKLRANGYHVELVASINGGQLLVIDWSK